MAVTLPDKIFGLDSSLAKLLVKPIVIIILLIMLFNWGVYPKIADIGRLKQEINKVNAEKQMVVDKINYINSLPPEDLKKNESLLNSALLYEKDAYFLVGVIRQIADKYSFTVQGFSLSPGKLTKDEKESGQAAVNKRVPVILNLIGPKTSYLNFLDGLEKSLPILSIEKMNMRVRNEVAEMDLEISAYYLDEETKPEIKRLTLADLKLDKNEAEMLKTLSNYTNNRTILSLAQEQIATRSGVVYGLSNPFR